MASWTLTSIFFSLEASESTYDPAHIPRLQTFSASQSVKTILRRVHRLRQYVVNYFCKVESERLEYLRHNAVTLLIADCTSLCDRLGYPGRIENVVDFVRSGRLYILPLTNVCADRYMQQSMHDIIPISNKPGYSNIFLTITCNPQ